MVNFVKDTDGEEYAPIDVRNTGETEFSVWFDDGDKKFNIPKSCMEDWPDKYKEGEALIVRWFAEQEGLI